MSLGKKLLGMFVESDGSEEASPPPAAQQGVVVGSSAPQRPAPGTRPASSATPPPRPVAAPSAPRGSDNVDPRLVAQLRQTIQENNRPGFDYYEFAASLQALAAVIPDESTRYRSAFATAATMGLTVPVLLESSQGYRDLLKQESGEFEKELVATRKTEVGNKQDEIEKIKKDIQTSSETIQRLTNEIAQAQQRAQALESQIVEANTKLERAKGRFQASVEVIDSEIAHHQDQIRALLAPGA